jgi:hypothetical protein
VHVADRRLEKDATDPGQDRIADPVQPRHRPTLNATGKAVAEHQVVTVAKLLDQRGDGGEVVAVVSVAHDHELAAGGLDAAAKRIAVALLGDVNDPDAQLFRDDLGAVGAAVVGDDDLRGQAIALDGLLRVLDACSQGFHLVQARHHDRHLDRGRARLDPPVSSLENRHRATA